MFELAKAFASSGQGDLKGAGEHFTAAAIFFKTAALAAGGAIASGIAAGGAGNEAVEEASQERQGPELVGAADLRSLTPGAAGAGGIQVTNNFNFEGPVMDADAVVRNLEEALETFVVRDGGQIFATDLS